MDESPTFNDENKQQSGKKRQQIESPFTAATPKSRIGKEPKRLFGQIKVNEVDGNLEDTCIDSDSRPNSAAPTEVTFDSSIMSNSYNVDPCLEQTEIFSAGTSANTTKDLSMVEESDETSADVTLANNFDSQLVVDEDRSTPVAPRLALSPIMKDDDDGAVTVPTPLASRIGRGLESIDTHSNTSMQSPMHHLKSHIDYSLHEFEILEQKVEHEEDVKELHEKIEELRERHNLEIIQINEARVYEERMLMQQMEAANKKAKSDREAAKAREQSLEILIKEMKMKMNEPDELKQQLENEVVELKSRIEELMGTVMQMNSVQEKVTAYETRVQQLEALELDITAQLTEARKEIESLQQKSVEMEEKTRAEIEIASSQSASSTVIDELKSDHEEVRSMMMEEIKRLENELSKQEDVANGIRSELEMSQTKVGELTASLEETKQQYNTAIVCSDESDQLKEALKLAEEKIIELTAQLDELRQQSESKETNASTLQKELDAVRQELSIASTASEDKDKKMIDLQTELETSRQELTRLSTETEEKVKHMCELQSNLDSVREELTLASDAFGEKVKELDAAQETISIIQNKLEASEDRIKLLETEQTELEGIRQNLVVKVEMNDQNLEKLSSSESKILELTATLEAIEAEVESAKEEARTAQNKIIELEASLKASQSYREELEAAKVKIEKLEAIENEVETMRQEAITNNQMIVEIQTKLISAETEVEKLTSAISSYNLELESARQETSSFENRIEELTKATEDLQAKLESSQHNAESTDDMKMKLETSETIILDLKSTLEALSVQLESARQNEKEVETLKMKIETMQSEFATAKEGLQSDLEAAIRQKDEELLKNIDLGENIQSLTVYIDSVQENSEGDKKKLKIELENSRQKIEQLEHRIEDILKENEGRISELTAKLAETESKISTSDVLQSQIAELTMQLENAKAEVIGAEQIYQSKMQELRDQGELVQAKLIDQRGQIEEAEMKIQRRDAELVNQAVQHKEQVEVLQAKLDEMRSSKSFEKESEAEELNIRIEELQAAITFAQKALDDAEQAKKQKDIEFEQVNQQMEELRKSMEEEKSSLQQTLQQNVSDVNEKLEAAEQALSKKENAIVTLESRIETMSNQFEERLGEANIWKTQALSVGTLTETMSQMQRQLKEMTEKLEASDRRVVEVEEMAQHDITLIQDEKKEQSAALEEAKSRIAQLEEKLTQSEKEISRLEKVCDDFDDDERELKEQIAQLQAEIKILKGVKSPPKTMGLLQKARLGVKPLSRESSHVEPPVNDDGYEDAHDSFQLQSQSKHQQSFNQTAVDFNSTRAQAAGTTMLHPDDQVVEKSTIETPSKKANRSNCQQQ